MDADIFPLKLATGEQFFNRVEERKKLITNIKKARHTVLISPRRYGKSSLVHYVIEEIKLAFVSVDLFLAHDDKAVIKRLLTGISAAVSQIMPAEEKALIKVKNFFSKFNTTLALGIFQIELAYNKGELDAVDEIYSALVALDKLAAQEKKKIIIFIDEFQDIATAQSAKSIQGAIRHVVQEAHHLMFIFSGSNRHLLLEMFDDKSMPLCMLCDKLHLERMESTEYLPHIQHLAQQRWKKVLPEMVFGKIMTLTELHPFYVNFLCHKVWQGNFPDSQLIETYWKECMEEESRRIRAELETLSHNQLHVIKALALEPTTEPTGQDFSTKSGIAPSSLHQTLKVLFEKDMVFKVDKEDPYVSIFKPNQVRVLDPLISYYLKHYL